MSFIDIISNFSFLGFHHWGYVAIFLAALLEATPLFGLLVPGMVIVVAGGFMAKLGILDIGDAIAIAATGAILGDLVGYALGEKYGVSFLDRYGKYFFFHKEQFEKTKRLMDHHTGKSLIIGRFNSLTRSFAPFIAGSTGTPFGKFLWFNIVGGVMWATSFIMIGFVFGQSYEAVSRYVGEYVTIAIVASIGIIYLYRFINKRKHIFSKYHLYTLMANIFSLYLFAKMVEDVIDRELITQLDVWLNKKMVLLQSPHLNDVMIFITNIASPLSLFLLSVFLLVVLIVKKKWYHMILLATGMTGGLLLEVIIKFLMHRERPVSALIEVSGYSFPSGHATMATIFFVLLLYAFKDDIKHKLLRLLFVFGTILTFILVGLSRVYLNVHWFSDVLAGFALGIFWLTLLVLVFKFIIAVAHKILYRIRDHFLQ